MLQLFQHCFLARKYDLLTATEVVRSLVLAPARLKVARLNVLAGDHPAALALPAQLGVAHADAHPEEERDDEDRADDEGDLVRLAAALALVPPGVVSKEREERERKHSVRNNENLAHSLEHELVHKQRLM